MTPARDVFRIAGSPPQDGCEDVAAACVVCARDWPRTHAYKRWQGASFTDQNRARPWLARGVRLRAR